jgi:catechol 2,3-dioxygenase-like lactoylglutathione lyase family enzyme
MENQLSTIIKSIQHVGIPVSDIGVSEVFYSRFGFKNVMQSTFEIDGEEGICIMMKNKKTILELYQMPEKQLREIRARKDGHIDHIAFDVDDIDKTFSMLKEALFTILEEKPVSLPSFWKNGCRYFNILGPDGERLEFNQILL